MRNLSTEFKEEQNNGNHRYLKFVDITLKNGTELHLDNSNLWNNGISFEEAVSSGDNFDVGAAIINKFSIVINNIEETFSEYVFSGAKAVVYVGLKLSTGIEKIRICTGTVSEEPKQKSSIINLTLLDNMSKFDRDYADVKTIFPATRNQIVRDICSVCGVTLQTVKFDHDDFIIQSRPDNEALTCRQMLAWVAQIGCQWAKCDEYGRLCIDWYKDISSEANNLINIKSITNMSVDLEDVVITGVKVTEYIENPSEDNPVKTYMYGKEGYVLSIAENKLITENTGNTIASIIGEKCVGMRFRPFSLNCITDISIEAGDTVKITDRKGKVFLSYATNAKLQPGNYEAISCGAESAERNSAKQYSLLTQVEVAARKNIQKEKTEREKALEELAGRLENSPGVFTTVETDTGGGKIYYLHNKPKLSDSDMVWKMTVEAWAVSTDGGKTWNAGMTVDGDTIVRILNAVGVNADWIETGSITVRDSNGDIIFSVDMDAKSVIISGDAVRIGGRPVKDVIDSGIAESKKYSDKKLSDYANTVSKDLEKIQSQVDGQVEDWYFDYEPSMQNIPASQWTTTEERQKHIGDRFFWKSKGYAYRFMEDNGIWGWILLQDTDITKAMQAAMEAQDTADGKRRTFVTTPQPPYDIGDLWTNGEDILTATVARDKGSVYVSSDWQKLNHYTDDTVANQALEEARKAHNIVMQLDNEYQGIPADWQGNITSFPTVQTTVQVFYGQQDVSASCSYSTNKSSGITGRWDNTRRTYTVTGLSADTGWVDITANYLGIFNVTKRFNVAKNKGGKPGEDGGGIQSITEHYAVSASNTTAPYNWSSTPPDMTSYNRYLWNYETFVYTNGRTEDTEKRVIGVYGDTGESGTDGKGIKNIISYYLASAQSSGITTSSYGWTTSPQSMSEQNRYLWNYEVLTYTDNTTHTVTPRVIGTYGKTGENGKPGRTYFIELSLQALKRGQDGLLTPDEITVHGYYRDGDSADRHDYVGRFQLQASSDGKTYTTVSSSSTDTSGQRFTQLNTVSKNYIFFRVNFYHPGGFTDLIDYQTIPVLIDIAALSKDDILDLITDNGKWQGFYKGPDGHIYISFEAARGGLMKLGGVNNGNGRQEIYDNRGNLIGRLDNTGLTFYYKYSQQGQGYSYTGITLNKDGLIYVEGSYTGDVYIDTVYEYVLSFDSTQTGVDGDFKNLDAAKATIANAVLNNITKMLVSGDATFSRKPKFNNGLNVADGNVQFPGWKFNGRFLESTDGHVKIRDKDGVARLESGNFQIMYGLDLHLAGQSGSGDFGDGGNPFNIYGLGTAVGSNLVINGNSVYRSSSSKRYKTIGRNVSEEDIEKWYQIQPVWAKYKNDYVNRNSSCFNKVMPMLIAEDVETYLPTAAVKNEEGLTDDWSERILIPAMFAMIKSQKEQIDAMKKEIEEIKKIAEQSGGGMK